MKKISTRLREIVRTGAISLLAAAAFASNSFAQSTDPDNPTLLTNNMIEATNAGGLNDERTYYYRFNVSKGTLIYTLDLKPTNRSDAGGYFEWAMLDAKYQNLTSDVLTAHGSPERQVKELPITIKRQIILKIVVSGNAAYKIRLSGSAVSEFKGLKNGEGSNSSN